MERHIVRLLTCCVSPCIRPACLRGPNLQCAIASQLRLKQPFQINPGLKRRTKLILLEQYPNTVRERQVS